MSEALRQYVRRACCKAALGGDFMYLPEAPAGVTPEASDREPSKLLGEVKQVFEALPLPRDRRAAFHEAAHATVGHALGMKIDHIIVDDVTNYVKFRPDEVNPRGRAVMCAAGEHGANWLSGRWVCRPPNDAVMPFIRGFIEEIEKKTCGFGGCDYCRIMLSIVSLLPLDINVTVEEAALNLYREIEVQTIELVQRPPVTRATKLLADRLMEVGRLDGETAHNLIEPQVPFDSITIDAPRART